MSVISKAIKTLLMTLCFTAALTTTTQAKEVVKFAQANQFRLLGYSAEHVGVYPYLGVLQFYMTLPEIAGKYEFKHVGNVYKSPNECLTAVASGAIQITYSTPSFLEQFNPNWKVASATGLFDNFEHFNRTIQTEPWQAMVKELEKKQRVKIVKWVGSLGSFMLFTNKPIEKIEDAKGLRIRYNGANGYVPAIQKLNMTPVALPFTEVVSALQTNMIDGLLSEIAAAPWYDLGRYAQNLVPITWVSTPMCLVVNADWWDSLDKDTKAVFEYAFQTPETYQFLDKDEARQISEWGTKVPNTKKANLTPEEVERWKTLLRDAGREFIKDVPADLIKAVEDSREKQ